MHRFFWLVVLGTAVTMMLGMLRVTLASFREDIVDVTFDTDYLSWTNSFPAISLCMARGYDVADLTRLSGEYLDQHHIQKPKACVYSSMLFVSKNNAFQT